MICFKITTEVKDDRRVLLTLPREVPTGQAELVVTVAPRRGEEPTRPETGLADWVEAEAGSGRSEQAPYPLRGSVVRYDQPTEPVAEADWEVLR